jgi:two-component system LytT family response regulator
MLNNWVNRPFFVPLQYEPIMELSAILIDDEPNNLINLESLLNKFCPDIKVIGKCGDAFEGKNKIDLLKPNLVFLDVNMPKVNGLELLKSYIQQLNDVKTIVVTAYEEYALEAFKLGAFGYILKPIDRHELISIVNNAKNYFESVHQTFKKEESAIPVLKPESKEDDSKIILNSDQGYMVLALEDIIKIEAVNNYSRIYHINKKQYVSSKTLKSYEELLPKSKFIRIHKSFLINLDHVKGIGKFNNTKKVFLSNNLEAIVARDKKVILKTALQG